MILQETSEYAAVPVSAETCKSGPFASGTASHFSESDSLDAQIRAVWSSTFGSKKEHQ